MTPVLTKNCDAEAALAQYRIATFGASDGLVKQAAAATDPLLGVTNLAAALGERVDLVHLGIALVEYGGAVTRGDQLTSDANGKAVTAAPATGVNNFVFALALVSGVDGDIVPALLALGQIQGA